MLSVQWETAHLHLKSLQWPEPDWLCLDLLFQQLSEVGMAQPLGLVNSCWTPPFGAKRGSQQANSLLHDSAHCLQDLYRLSPGLLPLPLHFQLLAVLTSISLFLILSAFQSPSVLFLPTLLLHSVSILFPFCTILLIELEYFALPLPFPVLLQALASARLLETVERAEWIEDVSVFCLDVALSTFSEGSALASACLD